MRPHERNEFVTCIRIHPHTVLDTNESGSIQKSTELIAYTSPPLVDIKNKHSPLPVPECRLRYCILSKLYLFHHFQSFFCNLHTALRILPRYGHKTVLF